MSNWFAGIGLASSGLDAARYGLNVVGQNMTNAGTPGYVRQAADQASVQIGGVGTTAVNSGMAGTTVTGTSRLTDAVLDARVRTEHARGSLADTNATQAAAIDALFPEPGDDGLSAQLSGFWADWGSLANDPGSAGARSVVLHDASALGATLNTLATRLGDLRSSTAATLSTDVDNVNSIATQLATLNGQVSVAAATGQNVNALLDRRDSLLQNLAGLTGGSVTIQPNGSATVTVGGQTLVDGSTATAMSVDASNMVRVGTAAVTLPGGKMAAESTALSTTIPGYQSRLDAVADRLASKVNTLQAGGYDQNGTKGTDLFTGSGAAGIKVALTDPAKLAAAGTPGISKDGSNALKASQFGAAADSPDALYTALVGDAASASALATKQASLQDAVVSNVDAMKAATSGVSLDEEAASMLTYQQAFNASSRVLTAIDSMLDTLINHTGVVGIR